MNNSYIYRAFGLTILSPFVIAQLPKSECTEYDVIISEEDLSYLDMNEDYVYTKEKEVYFFIQDIAKFRIADGRTIEVDLFPNCLMSKLGVYLMGSCMGAILHQRDFMPIHGSCVTNGNQSVLITGDSGAGKSTLAAEFLFHGWKLLTDDVTAIFHADSTPIVQASYPSQKLWQDTLNHYDHNDSEIHSLYFDDTREKFGVNVSDQFADTACPLSLIVRLIPTDEVCSITAVSGITQVDQLLRNTYRMSMVPQNARERHFRRCVALATKTPMVLVTRQNGVQCADKLYEMITNYLGEKNNG